MNFQDTAVGLLSYALQSGLLLAVVALVAGRIPAPVASWAPSESIRSASTA